LAADAPRSGDQPASDSPARSAGGGHGGGRRLRLAAFYLLYLWLLVELGSWVGLWALARFRDVEYQPGQAAELIDKHRAGLRGHLAGRDSYQVFDPELGWTVGPSRSRRGYRSNSRGIRADREYASQPPSGVLRIAAFGDSFTHASDVANPHTWSRRLEELAPGVEVLNFGVPGYGPDQAFLRYRREGPAMHPHLVFIGFMSENVGRMVNTFRPFYFSRTGLAFGKPRFILRGDGIELRANPLASLQAYEELLADPARVLPRVGEHDYYYQRQSRRSRLDLLPSVRLAWVVRNQFFDQPVKVGGQYNPRAEPFLVSVRVVEAFYREVLADGALPVVVLFPERRDLRARKEGGEVAYATLRDAFRERGLRTVDLMDGFVRLDPELTLAGERFLHYPPRGNRMVATYLWEWLRQEGLDTPEGVRAARDVELARRADHSNP
jgi:hypothetical protein